MTLNTHTKYLVIMSLSFMSPLQGISWIFIISQNTAFKMWLLNLVNGQAVTSGDMLVERYSSTSLPSLTFLQKSHYLIQQCEKPRINNEGTVLHTVEEEKNISLKAYSKRHWMLYINETNRKKKHFKLWRRVFTCNGLLLFSPNVIMMLSQLYKKLDTAWVGLFFLMSRIN